ncbi:O-antigen ligase family protein [Patescibacteria group bacterium]|nr:O-antigen ligase family protein [Patescibacteria group bacterium]MBU0963854.1 O-antigen ligase family protein [Patescibacteria group bacterium]
MIEIVLIIIFTLLFIVLAWWKLDWAISFCIVFLPAYLLRFKIWLIPVTILEIMLIVVFLVWLIKVFSQNKGTLIDRCKSIWWPWQWLILLFVVSGIVAVLISPDTRQALGLWKAYILEPVLFFIVFVNTMKSGRQKRMVVWAFGMSAVVVGFIAILQYLNIIDIPAHYGLEIPKRATSLFPFPTAIGKFVGPILALFLGLWLGGNKSQEKTVSPDKKGFINMFLLGVICFSCIGLILSVSRGALLGVFAALILISFFSRWKKWLWIGLAFLVLLILAIPQTRNNVLSVFKATDVSTDVRLVMWQGAGRIIEDNPISGTGLASFPVVYEDYKEASHTEFFPNPDHLILTLWIEMGLSGLIIFGWLIIRFFTAGFKLASNYPLAVGLLAAMTAIIVHGFLDTPYFKNDLAVQFWILMGLMILLHRGNQGKHNTISND